MFGFISINMSKNFIENLKRNQAKKKQKTKQKQLNFYHLLSNLVKLGKFSNGSRE